ncbi:hypothetical protein [Paracoccus rhizosphaerae]
MTRANSGLQMSYRSKTLSLQRAYFHEGFNRTLEDVLRLSFEKLDKVEDRLVDKDFFSKFFFASLQGPSSGIGVFVRVLEIESAVGVINFDTTDPNAAVEEFFHPGKREFLKEEMVFYVVRNHILACNLKNKAGTLSANMLELAANSGVLDREAKMRIADVPDQTTLARIEEIGVKEVLFTINNFMENLNVSARHPSGSRVMQMIFGMPSEGNDVRKRANAIGKIILSRGKFVKDEVQKDQWLTEIGKELTEADSVDSFRITLEDGTKASNSMLRKSKVVKLPRHANSYSFDHAKKALELYYKDLATAKLLG